MSDFLRLPSCIKPKKYILDYNTIDVENYRFQAFEEVELEVIEATSVITCNAIELHVYDVFVRVRSDNNRVVKCSSIQYVEHDQLIRFQFPESFQPGMEIVLVLKVNGILNDDLRGFYRSEYEHDGEKRIMAVTQYQSCDARRAFVCWDEPGIKSTFKISMTTDPKLTAVSNMHVTSTFVQKKSNSSIRTQSNRTTERYEKKWQFAETKIMSTYLVAMVVGEFDIVSDYTPEGVQVNVFTPIGKSNQGQFALQVGLKALSIFTEKFQIDYPLRKLDMLAIPDFAAGAMENWGCITYAEAYLLVDEKQSSLDRRMDVALTVAHEVAHQWFGNLVTMDWWTGLWLNEGFAHFMEFECVNSIFPNWNIWDKFITEITIQAAMKDDSLLSSHPIEVEVNHPDEADEIFDNISYCKGASIIRMVYEYLGSENFYKGLNHYLNEFAYNSTKTEDLWKSLELVSNIQLAHMMESWTRHMGFPVVTLTRTGENQFQLSQQRYLANKDWIKDVEANNVYDIPLTVLDQADKVTRIGIWAPENVDQTIVHADTGFVQKLTSINANTTTSSTTGWIKLNSQQIGFYVDNYCEKGWSLFQTPIENATLNAIDRMTLLNHMFMLTRAGQNTLSQALTFMTYFKKDPEYIVWKVLCQHLTYYLNLYQQEPFSKLFKEYIGKVFQSSMATLQWVDIVTDNCEDKLSATASSKHDEQVPFFRRDIINILGAVNDTAVVAEAKNQFQLYTSENPLCILTSDLRGVVFRIVAQNGGKDEYEQLRQVYETNDFAETKFDCLRAIGNFKDLKLKSEILNWALANVRAQDIQYVFGSLSRDVQGAQKMWSYVKQNWAQLNEKYIQVKVGAIVCNVINAFQSENDVQDVLEFVKDKNCSAYHRKLDIAIESIRIKTASYQRNKEELKTFLGYVPSS